MQGNNINLDNLTFTPQQITQRNETTHITFTKVNNTVYVNGKTVEGILKIEAGGQSITKNISMSAIDVYENGKGDVQIKSNEDEGIKAVTNSGEWDREVAITNEGQTAYQDGILYGYVNIALTNNKTYTARVGINASRAISSPNLSSLIFTPQQITQSQTIDIQFTEGSNTAFVVGKTVQGILKIEVGEQPIIKNISMTAAGVYNKGWDEGLASATVSSLIVTKKSGADPQYYPNTIGGVKRWLIPVTIFGSVTGTKSDGTSYSKQYPGPDTTVLDFTTIYNDIIENSGGSRTITSLSWTGSGYTKVNATFDKGESQTDILLPMVEGETLYSYAYKVGRNSVDALKTVDGTPQVFYESIEGGSTDYTKLWIRLENENAIHNIDVSGAYNAGVSAGNSSPNISKLTFISASNFSQDLRYVSYDNSQSSGTSSYTSTVTANLKVNDTQVFENVPVDITEITNKLLLYRWSVGINTERGTNGYQEIGNKKYLYLNSNYELRFNSARIVDWHDGSELNRVDISNYVNGSSTTPSYTITGPNFVVDEQSYDSGYYYDGINSKIAVTGTIKVDGVQRSIPSFDIPAGPIWTKGKNSASGGGISISDVIIRAANPSTYSTSADKDVSLGYDYVKYDSDNDMIKGKVSISLGAATGTTTTQTLFITMDASRKSNSGSWNELMLDPTQLVLGEKTEQLSFGGDYVFYDSSTDIFTTKVKILHGAAYQTYWIYTEGTKKTSSGNTTPTTGYTIDTIKPTDYILRPDYQFESSPTTRYGYNYLPIKINLSNGDYKTVQVYWEDSGNSGQTIIYNNYGWSAIDFRRRYEQGTGWKYDFWLDVYDGDGHTIGGTYGWYTYDPNGDSWSG